MSENIEAAALLVHIGERSAEDRLAYLLEKFGEAYHDACVERTNGSDARRDGIGALIHGELAKVAAERDEARREFNLRSSAVTNLRKGAELDAAEIAALKAERDEAQALLKHAQSELGIYRRAENGNPVLAEIREMDDLRMREIGEVRRERDAARGQAEQAQAALELLGDAWVVIANADGWNWDTDADLKWRAAAEKWRDNWHAFAGGKAAAPKADEPKPNCGAEHTTVIYPFKQRSTVVCTGHEGKRHVNKFTGFSWLDEAALDVTPVPASATVAVDPNSCQHDGINKHDHAWRWVEGVGWHTWSEPSDELRKARMLARRAAPGADTADGTADGGTSVAGPGEGSGQEAPA